VTADARVLELGCWRGDLLAALNPSYGLGIEFCEEVIAEARQRHPAINFLVADVTDLAMLDEKFDYIILSDLVNDLWDVQ